MIVNKVNEVLKPEVKLAVNVGLKTTMIGAVDENGELLELMKFATTPTNFKPTYIRIKNFMNKYGYISLIAFSIIGSFDDQNGLIIDNDVLPGWNSLEISTQFEQEYPEMRLEMLSGLMEQFDEDQIKQNMINLVA